MNDGVGFYLRISYGYKYRATNILLKQTQLELEKYTFKYDKFLLQVQCPVNSALC